MSQWSPDAEVVAQQIAICEKYQVPHTPPRYDLKVGINLGDDLWPVNGHRESEDPAFDQLSGWWMWNGQRDIAQDDPDFFDSLHGWHLPERCPIVMPYLGLPPGWRFLIAPDYEDVWYDPKLV
jgi:hypothetical protein